MHEGTHDTTDLELNGKDCENCGAANAGAIVAGTIYCGGCASAQLEGSA